MKPTETAPEVAPNSKKCDCLTRYNERLKQDGLEVSVVMQMIRGEGGGVSGLRLLPELRTAKISGKGGKTPYLVPVYCPFCGVKYDVE